MLEDADSQEITRRRPVVEAGAGAGPVPNADDGERLLDLLERWDELYRRDRDASPESLGVRDDALMNALRKEIALRKHLYGFLGLSPSGNMAVGEGGPVAPLEGRRDVADQQARPGAEPIPPRADTMSIGRYRVLRVLGDGGFGRVYLAYDPDLQRNVAIKVPARGDLARFLDVEAYLREARIVARLSHPNIVPVYDVGHADDGRGYVVSKYMEGGDLKTRLERGRPSFADSAELVAVLCDALQYTHTQDLFHRDIKPGNILLDAAGVPSLADFGLALRDEDVGQGASYLGTAAYMSPEQARGEGHRVDGRSDIFSMGVVLYELLVGRRPFRGRSHLEIMEQVVNAEPRPPRQIDGTIPGELERICLKALAKRASERYTTARDLAEDLRHFLNTVTWAAPTSDVTPVAPSEREPAPGPAPGTSDSNWRPIKIVPKGLGSFDEGDADFFLELLPGPRDRDGLPEGLRFWKTRIESTDPERAFRVGLIYGPSGCGKSSMVKAGLLPQLGPQVSAIYVESTGDDTEARLRRGLRRLFPALPLDGDLVGGLKVLRRGQGLPAGRKVLLVLDQFEQWLFAHRGGSRDDELVAALRQCDGEHLQALCLVRDDFWMAATRFMRELDIDLIPGRNVAVVDLFEPRHAHKVLTAFGRAYEALPGRSADLTRDQGAFLEQGVAGLAQDGWIVPVRLALFAEMVKGRPWTPATLREVGGMEGVGARFLDDCFGSPRATPNHRYHQAAAQAVLKALLPEANADIKGRMRSIEQLRAASGYTDRQADFAELIRMLDAELRLITPVDPDGSLDEDRPPARAADRCFQLTHDYLVHSLRDWLTRKQRETRRGRAELLLAERAADWGAKPEDRYLPSFREWASIRLLTRRKDWSESQRRMMRRAGRRIGLRGLGGAIIVGMTAFVGLEAYSRSHADGLVARLASADTPRVPEILREIERYRSWAEPRLRSIVSHEPDDSRAKLHASLALLPRDSGQIGYLYSRLLTADPMVMVLLRDRLGPYLGESTGRLRGDLRTARPQDPRILPLAGVLAALDPGNREWNGVGDAIATAIVRVPPRELDDWRDALRGVRADLIGPLSKILRDQGHGDERAFAASVLADYVADDPKTLVDLLLDADPKSFSILFGAVRDRRAGCLDGLRAATAAARTGPGSEATAAREDATDPGSSREAAIESARDRTARRGARAAVALLRLGYGDDAWRMLEYSPDPRARSALIDALPVYGADPAPLLEELLRPGGTEAAAAKNGYLFHAITSRRRALILALAGYPAEALDARQRDAMVARLEGLYREDPDAGVHSAAELALRRWEAADRLKLGPSPAPRAGGPVTRRWYVNPAGQTMVVVDGPVRFRMGTPPTDPERESQEFYHWQVVPRRFAIATKEVTIEEYQEFARATGRPPHPYNRRYSPEPGGPINRVNWYEAVAYCNWLSERDSLRPCYVPADAGGAVAGMRVDPVAVERGGYRLLTEVEWEYACRAGSVTSRHFGGVPELLGKYEWYVANAGFRAHPCGRLLPNELGLFDMSGNVTEWSHGRFPGESQTGPGPEEVLGDAIAGEVVSRNDRSARGGTFYDPAPALRSAERDWREVSTSRSDIGFRVGRTLPDPS
jgi:serine/threonine protein kinase/formylglycine-generating enzyme required for sulfatase activity